jgi:LPXTG-site transpeptidase (sortase) family protein
MARKVIHKINVKSSNNGDLKRKQLPKRTAKKNSFPKPEVSLHRKPLRLHLGNFMIFLALLIFVLIYYPLVLLFLPPLFPKPALAETSFYINIPKISARAPIVDQVDPGDKKVYSEALTHGVALAKGFAEPGQPGTIYIFAHSSDFPWNISRYNTIFLKLGNLQPGDPVEIHKNGQIYKYQVFDKKEVWPTEVQYLKNNQDVLILQTCTPIGTSLKRLLVFAKPV